jgi:phosphonate transport system substrate-binding protein
MNELILAVPVAPEAVPHDMSSFTRSLGARLGRHVELLAVPTYAALARVVEDRLADLVWAPPLVALDLSSWGTATVAAAVVRSGTTSYPSLLVTSKHGRFRDVADLVGARVAWVSRLSAAGHVVPRLYLDSMGLAPSMLGRQTFLQGHRAALDAVVEGRADVAAAYGRRGRDGTLTLPHSDPSLAVLAVAGWVPSDVVMMSQRLVPELGDEVGHALSRMTPTELSPLGPLFDTERFDVADESHLDELRGMVARARVSAIASEPPGSVGALQPWG